MRVARVTGLLVLLALVTISVFASEFGSNPGTKVIQSTMSSTSPAPSSLANSTTATTTAPAPGDGPQERRSVSSQTTTKSSFSSEDSTTIGPSTCFGLNHLDDSLIPPLARSLRIALVQPIFTSTPYSEGVNGSFYTFYRSHLDSQGNVTDDLYMLSTDVSSAYTFRGGWGWSHDVYGFVASKSAQDCGMVIGKNLHILNDINVSEGALFQGNGSAGYDAVIVPFSEYVTQNEYNAYRHFVRTGGTLVLTAAGNFLARVTYDPRTHMETLVGGHGWTFDGRSASRTIEFGYWRANNSQWVGSSYFGCCHGEIAFSGARTNATNTIGKALTREFGGRVFNQYGAHEENVVTNTTATTIVATFANRSDGIIASYVHHFGRGTVVCMCVFGDNIISNSVSTKYFLLVGVISSRLGTTVTCSRLLAGLRPPGSLCTATVTGWSPTGVVSWRQDSRDSRTPLASCTLSSEGRCSVILATKGVPGLTLIGSYGGDSNNAPTSDVFVLPTAAPK